MKANNVIDVMRLFFSLTFFFLFVFIAHSAGAAQIPQGGYAAYFASDRLMLQRAQEHVHTIPVSLKEEQDSSPQAPEWSIWGAGGLTHLSINAKDRGGGQFGGDGQPLMIGLNVRPRPWWVLNVTLMQDKIDLDLKSSKGSGNFNSKGVQAAIAYKEREDKGAYFGAQFGYVRHEARMSEQLQTGSNTGEGWLGSTYAGYAIPLDANTALTPSARLFVSRLSMNPFYLSNPVEQVPQFKKTQGAATFAISLSRTLTTNTALSLLNSSIRFDVHSGYTRLFNTDGVLARDVLNLGLGSLARVSDPISIFINIEFEVAKRYNNSLVSIGLDCKW